MLSITGSTGYNTQTRKQNFDRKRHFKKFWGKEKKMEKLKMFPTKNTDNIKHWSEFNMKNIEEAFSIIKLPVLDVWTL